MISKLILTNYLRMIQEYLVYYNPDEIFYEGNHNSLKYKLLQDIFVTLYENTREGFRKYNNDLRTFVFCQYWKHYEFILKRIVLNKQVMFHL